MQSGINNRVYLSADLEIQLIEDGAIQATLSWPIDHYHVQHQVNLAMLDSQAQQHYRSLDGFAKRLGSAKEEAIENFVNSRSEFATAFFKSLFVGKLERGLYELADSADGRTILLAVDIPSGPLEILPWEMIGDEHIALSQPGNKPISITVYRKSVLDDIRSKLEIGLQQSPRTDKVKLMRVGSQPYRRSALHIGAEFAVIESVLKENQRAMIVPGNDISYSNVDYATFTQLLYRNKPQALHLACHGTRQVVDFSRGESEQLIPHKILLNDILGIDTIKLVVLNICYSAACIDEAGQYLRSLAGQLVESGIPAVVGMATSITDLAAIEFSRWFYLTLSQEKSVCEAFYSAIAKLRIFNQADKNLWSVPMLYLNENVNPFMEILDEAKEFSGPPLWPVEFIEDTINITNEFVAAFKRLHPQPQWNAFNWQIETRKVYRVFMQTLKQLMVLGNQFSSARYLQHRTIVLEIADLQKQIVQELEGFGRRTPDWGSLDFRNPQTAIIIRTFMQDGVSLVEKMERLISKLESVLRTRI